MSVPTSNLYDFVHQVTENSFVVLYFYPYGHKDIDNIIMLPYPHSHPRHLKTLTSNIPESKQLGKQLVPKKLYNFEWMKRFQPVLMCHDQEPLNFDLYSDQNIDATRIAHNGPLYNNFNLRHFAPHDLQKYWILLHSELNSPQEKIYQDSGMFKTAYWWSHALLSRDWYRYAEYDHTLDIDVDNKKDFLVYARDFSGSRAYRKEFLNKITHLSNQCQVGSFLEGGVSSDASAIYDSHDFIHTNVSVVLETVFDQRIHLTEKTLRPIACGHPFIIANGPGTLKYLRSYGFKTFSPWIDESYDLEEEPDKRLQFIVNSMKTFAELPTTKKQEAILHCKKIAQHNKKVFFSNNFQSNVVQELITNVDLADKEANREIDWKKYQDYIFYTKKHNPTRANKTDFIERRKVLIPLIRHLKKGGTLDDYVPPNLD